MWHLVLVDFDDTLVETAPSFRRAREALFRRLEEEGFDPADAHRIHHDVVEPELLEVFGMGPFRLEPSFRDTYVRMCVEHEQSPDPEVAEACSALGRDIMGRPALIDGSLEALERLAARLPTVIYSQASFPRYQLGRIRDAGVTGILPEERVRITPGKTRETFLEALEHFGVSEPARTLMIGNSVRSDINPALEAGARAALVEPYEMWQFDNVPPVSDDFLRFPTFSVAVEHVLEEVGSSGPGKEERDPSSAEA